MSNLILTLKDQNVVKKLNKILNLGIESSKLPYAHVDYTFTFSCDDNTKAVFDLIKKNPGCIKAMQGSLNEFIEYVDSTIDIAEIITKETSG